MARHAPLLIIGLLVTLLAGPAQGDEAELERRLLELERELMELEQAMAAPADARLAIYLGTEVGALLRLQSVRLELDGHPLAARLYRPEEGEALRRGGMDRLHLGVIPPGEHRLRVWVVGTGPHQRPYRLSTEYRFRKDTGPLALRIQITDVLSRLQPRLEVAPW